MQIMNSAPDTSRCGSAGTVVLIKRDALAGNEPVYQCCNNKFGLQCQTSPVIAKSSPTAAGMERSNSRTMAPPPTFNLTAKRPPAAATTVTMRPRGIITNASSRASPPADVYVHNSSATSSNDNYCSAASSSPPIVAEPAAAKKAAANSKRRELFNPVDHFQKQSQRSFQLAGKAGTRQRFRRENSAMQDLVLADLSQVQQNEQRLERSVAAANEDQRGNSAEQKNLSKTETEAAAAAAAKESHRK